VLTVLRLRTLHGAENIGSALKRGVNVCQRHFVNEVLGPSVTEFIRNFGGEDATPIQHAFPTAARGRARSESPTQTESKLRRSARSANSSNGVVCGCPAMMRSRVGSKYPMRMDMAFSVSVKANIF
jgi:hypothetical protein